MPKPIADQVVVITGASSGIGRQTAVAFAARGAKVVLAARNVEALRQLAEQIGKTGGLCHVIGTDVTAWSQVQGLADEAVRHFGHIDTWVNDAGVSIYGTVDDTPVEDMAQVIQTDLLGTIYGTKAALAAMRPLDSGTIINVGSVLSVAAAPLQAAYVAAKHAVKGFTESLRMELEHDKSNIHLTLIMPSSINTPFFAHARSWMGVRPAPLPPVYEPEAVAEAILYAAEHPRRDIVVGGAGKMLALLQRVSPRLIEKILGSTGFSQQRTGQPDDGHSALHQTPASSAPSSALGAGASTISDLPEDAGAAPAFQTSVQSRARAQAAVRGDYATHGHFGAHALRQSLYTRWVEQHPVIKGLLLAGAAYGLARMVARVVDRE